MADLSSEVRLFYIGLWCVADDAGWIAWNTATIAADLFPYANRRVREGHVEKWAGELRSVGRLVRHECGCVVIPTLPDHQRIGGVKSFTALDKHNLHSTTDQSVAVGSDPSPTRANNANATNNRSVPKGGAGGNGLPHITDDVAVAWEAAAGVSVLASGAFATGYLDDACRRHPSGRVVEAITAGRRGFSGIPSTQQLAAAVRAILDPLPDGKASKQLEAESREAERSRRAVQATKKRTHDIGYHADEPDPMCDLCNGREVA